jgi:hypothetical protein
MGFIHFPKSPHRPSVGISTLILADIEQVVYRLQIPNRYSHPLNSKPESRAPNPLNPTILN